MREAARRGVFSGERNGQAKIDDMQALFIRIMHMGGESIKEIAATVPVKPRQIHYIVSRHSWKHVDPPKNLPPVTPESARATIVGASRVMKKLLAVYRENGWPIREEYLNTLAACESFLGR